MARRRVCSVLLIALALVGASAGTLAEHPQVMQAGPPPPPPPPPGVAPSQSQSPSNLDPPPGTGLLFGQVVDATTRKPVAGAIVIISGSTIPVAGPNGAMVSRNPLATSAPDVPRQVLTGGTGQFVFRALPAGRYTVRVTAPGYVSGAYGQVRPNGATQSIELTKDDEKRGDLSIRIWKTASISGRITDEAGEGIMNIGVTLVRRTAVNGRVQYSMDRGASTDDRGVYRLSGLAPGDYVVGVITTQSTMPASTVDAYYQLMMSGGSATADLTRELNSSDAPYPGGSGVRVGDYVLSPSRGLGSMPPSDDARLLYPTQFYPAASAPAQATGITLVSGEERTGIDLQLKPVTTMRVSGIASGPDGPVRNLGLRLVPAAAADFTSSDSDSTMAAGVTATDANGTFMFLGVPPGQYVLKSLRVPLPVRTAMNASTMIEISMPGGGMVMSSSGPVGAAPDVPLPTDPTLYGNMPVMVREADLTGLVLTLHVGARVSGRIVFDGTSPPPAPDIVKRAFITISPTAGGSYSLSSATKRIENDGRFASVGYPPGTYTVSGSVPSTPNTTTWRFRSASVDGRDVTDAGLAIDASDITNLVLTFVDHSSDVTGTVMDAKGQPDKTATVVVVPADSQAWKQGVVLNSRRVRSTRPNTNGLFTLTDLPPGSYFIAAIAEESLDNWQDPKTLEAIVRVATTFTLKDNEKLTQSLTTRTIR